MKIGPKVDDCIFCREILFRNQHAPFFLFYQTTEEQNGKWKISLISSGILKKSNQH